MSESVHVNVPEANEAAWLGLIHGRALILYLASGDRYGRILNAECSALEWSTCV